MGDQIQIIAVSGGSGSGKTTFSKMLAEKLGDACCNYLSQDNYYYDWSAHFDKDGGSVNFDHPTSLDFDLLKKHLQLYKSGRDIMAPQYCFKTHSRLDQCLLVKSKPILILDGILILNQTQLHPYFDKKYYIHTEEEVRFQRRLERDVKERGRTPEGVHEQFYSQVKPMHDKFVEPSQKYADVVLCGESKFDAEISKLMHSLNLDCKSASGRGFSTVSL
ncbi:MAG: uridine kinase [Bdellovibrionales bacterium]|nr:uridine kinase [Bdellovibrionales bacterium]